MRKRIFVNRRRLFLSVGGDIFLLHVQVGPVTFMLDDPARLSNRYRRKP